MNLRQGLTICIFAFILKKVTGGINLNKIEKFWEAIFNKIADGIMGPTIYKDPIILNSFDEFFKKLVDCKAILYVVKDPYRLAFAPDYLLWMQNNDDVYHLFVSPDNVVWKNIQENFEISFPSADRDHPWATEITWSKIEEKINFI